MQCPTTVGIWLYHTERLGKKVNWPSNYAAIIQCFYTFLSVSEFLLSTKLGS